MGRSKFAPLVILFAFIVPTNTGARFDGLPFDSWWEVLVVSFCLFLSLILAVHKEVLFVPDRVRRPSHNRFIAFVSFILIVKIAVYFTAPTIGQFEVCYRNFNERDEAPCAATFEPHPFFASISKHFARRSSEVPAIDFGFRSPSSSGISGSNWRLPTVNSLDFDQGFWPWIETDKSIDSFPFRAEYRGTVSLLPGDRIQVAYLGEGQVTLGGTTLVLAPSYKRINSVDVEHSGKSRLVVHFAYLRTNLNSNPQKPPYAVLRVEKLSQGEVSLLKSDFPKLLRVLNLTTDLSVLMMLLGLLWLGRSQFRKVIVSVTLGGLCWFLFHLGLQVGVGRFVIEAAVVYLAVLLVLLRRLARSLLILAPAAAVAGYCLTVREIELTRGFSPQLGDILVLLRGNDHLVYQGLTREMLRTGFLRGAEDVYYFQPGIRYIFYLLRVLLGESGVLLGAVSVCFLSLGILYFIDGLPKRSSRTAAITFDVASVSLLIWWSSSHTLQSTIDGLSEFGTWILLFVIFGYMVRADLKKALPLISVATAIVIWIRPNQGFGMMALLVLAAVLRRGCGASGREVISAALAPFGALLILIPIHNVLYGRTLVLLPVGHLNAGQTDWTTILKAFSNGAAREFMLGQLQGLLYIPSVMPDIYSPRIALAVVGFAVVAILTSILIFKNRGNPKLPLTLLVMAVLGQIVPFLKFTVYRYYPIHNIAIYLTFVLSCVTYAALTDRPRRMAPKS